MTELNFDVTNPATGVVIASVAEMNRDDCKQAIDAANAALPAWRALTAKARGEILRKWFDIMTENTQELAAIMTAECGKSAAEATGEAAFGASFVKYYAEQATRVLGEVIPSPSNDRRLLVIKQPIGVTAAITPWNFPMAMITRKCAPALAAGCTMVIKPAESTPLTALKLAEYAIEAGIPEGVLSIVTASSGIEIGQEFCENPIVRKLSFTGSTATGRILMRQSADSIKKLSLELGGNAPFIVFDDADIDKAVAGAMAAKYRNSGQTCVCVNRLMVQDGIYDEFATKYAEKVAELKVGNGADDGVNQGPLINMAGVVKAEAHVADALSKGAKLLAGGKRHELGFSFFEPTVLVDVPKDALIATEEVFAPVAALFRFKTEEEAVNMANDTEFGLAAYFFTENISRTWRVAEALEYGMVGINEGIISNEFAPFGGIKQSGLGREGSTHGIDDYLEMKYLCMGGLDFS